MVRGEYYICVTHVSNLSQDRLFVYSSFQNNFAVVEFKCIKYVNNTKMV